MSGYKVLVVTLDTMTIAWRPADLDGAYIPFLKGIGVDVGFSDPVFREMFSKKHGGAKPERQVIQAADEWLQAIFGTSHTWEDIALLRESWDGPIVLKGIQNVDDAKLALRYGCEGIIVSNHGGNSFRPYYENR
jgi:lactate 2-monooxygenase